ncbi:hypothetical protein L8P88_19815, partial [Enterobacter roggenkampii]|nr:hypothetical protein [Enterobacter roggenkampii]
CGKKIGPDPRNFNQRVSLGRNDLLIRTFLNCSVPNVKIAANDKMNHVESVSLQYEKITWRIVDGNIMHSDAWNERPTA